jgi:outer membrane protein assembly factor BamB
MWKKYNQYVLILFWQKVTRNDNETRNGEIIKWRLSSLKRSKFICLSVFLLLVTSLAMGCTSSSATPGQTSRIPLTSSNGLPTATVVSSPSPGSLTPTTSTTSSSDDWPTYHRDPSRSGFTQGVSPGSTAHPLWTSDRLDGDIYAEPLVVSGKTLVATEQNSVYALDFQTGKLLWHVNLGSPVPLSELSCGNIDPSGITSTPVADPIAGRLYVVARIQPNHHEIFALDIDTGATVFHRTVDPPGSDPRVQQQRAAMALSGDRVNVAFGGLAGDCGNFYGWLVGAPLNVNDPLTTYRVSSHRGCSLWAPSGPAVDSSGNLYVASGNGYSGSTFDYGNAVLRLSASLSLEDWFAPANWQDLDNGDIDLGSMGPILLEEGLVFQAGKEGKGYLLHADNLGHIGGEIFTAAIGGGAYGGAAYAPPYLFVPCTNGLVALQVDASPSFKVIWSSPDFFAGPPVVSGTTVWTVDIGSGTLYGFSVDKGEVINKTQLGSVVHFTTPSLSAGRIVVAANRQIICLGP